MQKRRIQKLDCDNNQLTGQVLADLLQIVPIQRLHLVKSVLTEAQVRPLADNLI
jgi:hypothetical protein